MSELIHEFHFEDIYSMVFVFSKCFFLSRFTLFFFLIVLTEYLAFEWIPIFFILIGIIVCLLGVNLLCWRW